MCFQRQKVFYQNVAEITFYFTFDNFTEISFLYSFVQQCHFKVLLHFSEISWCSPNLTNITVLKLTQTVCHL